MGGGAVNQQWPQHQDHYNHQVSARDDSMSVQRPSAVKLHAILTHNDEACLFCAANDGREEADQRLLQKAARKHRGGPAAPAKPRDGQPDFALCQHVSRVGGR